MGPPAAALFPWADLTKAVDALRNTINTDAR